MDIHLVLDLVLVSPMQDCSVNRTHMICGRDRFKGINLRETGQRQTTCTTLHTVIQHGLRIPILVLRIHHQVLYLRIRGDRDQIIVLVLVVVAQIRGDHHLVMELDRLQDRSEKLF